MSAIFLLIAVTLSWMLGLLLATSLAGRGSGTRLVRCAVALPLGLAVTSAARFAVFMLLPVSFQEYGTALTVDLLLVALAGVLLKLVRPPRYDFAPRRGSGLWAFITTIALAAVLLLFFCRSAQQLWSQPFGDFDAVSIWNVRARFLYRAGMNWRDSFVASVHSDYPLNLPLSIERLWRYAGHETLLAPTGIALLSMAAVIAILFAAVRQTVGTTRACAAVMALLALPLFLGVGTIQYADVPIAALMLGSVTALWMATASPAAGRWIALSGVMAGAAAWTKNEGLLWTLALGVGVVIAELFRSNGTASDHAASSPPVTRINRGVKVLRHVLAFGLGALPFLAVVFWMKLSLSATNDVLKEQNRTNTLERIFDLDRHAEIFRGVWQHLLWPADHYGGTASVRWPGHFVLWVLAVYVLAAGVSLRGRWPAMTATLAALSITLAGFYGIYLITPHDLYYHIANSITRLFLQLYPIILLVIFSITRPMSRDNLNARPCHDAQASG
ncbi:MAG: glycosyltransferase family 39 protein [Phycisphaeraceae bacterium]|nr:glycosyltransferase family 39 protein [Phycisphaeraceae bacterium]